MFRAQNLRLSFLGLIAVSVVLFVRPVTAGSISTVMFDAAHQTAGDQGDAFRPVDFAGSAAGLLLRARLSSDSYAQLTNGSASLNGSMWIGRRGLELRRSGFGRDSAAHSGVSFTFDQPSSSTDMRLGLRSFAADFDSYLALNILGEEDQIALDKFALDKAYVSTGPDEGFIDFARLGIGDVLIESFSIGGMQGDLSMTFATFSAAALPLPTALLVGLVGIASVVVLRRRAL